LVKEKPESLLDPQVKRTLVQVCDQEIKAALDQGEEDKASSFARARKLVERGCWSIRKSNPYLVHMEKCLTSKGGSLEATQAAMIKCAREWKKLAPAERKKYEAEISELDVYDFL